MGLIVVAISQGSFGRTVTFTYGSAASILAGTGYYMTMFEPSDNYSVIPHATSYVVYEFRDSETGNPVAVSGSATLGVWADSVFTPMLVQRVGWAPTSGTTISEANKQGIVNLTQLGDMDDEDFLYPVIEFSGQSRIGLFVEGKPTNVPWDSWSNGLALQLALYMESVSFDVQVDGPAPHGSFIGHNCPDRVRPGAVFSFLVAATNEGELVWETGSGVNLHAYGDCNVFNCDGRLYFDDPVIQGQDVFIQVEATAPVAIGDYTLFFDLCVDAQAFNDAPLTIPCSVVKSVASVEEGRRSSRKLAGRMGAR